ncbi:MAG: response regulator [Lachnospiraceae bacterium]|nr:response regulator [Lachnospiraceae bacterium]
MYKVLIADDEDIICRGLAGMISRRSKLQVAALAEDGEIALEKAKEVQPDLMLVDINMPFLNGLELIERIREVLPDALIIIVTGYDDFEFVQKALQLGVADYVLKPVMEQAFFEVLDKAVERLDSMAHSRKYISWMEEWVEQNRPKIIEDFFNSLLRETMDEDEFKKHMEYLKIRIPVPYAVTVIHVYSNCEKEIHQTAGSRSDTDHNDGNHDDQWYLICQDVIQKCFEPYSEVTCFQTEEGAMAVISKLLLQQQWRELEEKLVSQMDRCLHAGIELVWRHGSHESELPDVLKKTMEIYKERMHYSDIVLQTIGMIRMQWGDSELSLQSVADALYVSAPYLSRMFHKETGENFASFLTRKRMTEAKLLLKNTNMKMYEIAQRTGYTSQHYFSNAFKKAMGISPADYRKNFLK